MRTIKRLPSSVKEALVTVCGKSFWLKEPLCNIFREAGVPEDVISEYYDEPKFKFARHVIAKLETMDEEGWLMQQKILTKICNLRNLIEDEVPNRNAGIDALRNLKTLALKENMIVKVEKDKKNIKLQEHNDAIKKKSARESKIKELLDKFNDLIKYDNHQSRGYSLENLLYELFTVNEIEYHPPYKTETEQIDGYFHFQGFDYIVEARWRKEQPHSQEIGGFKSKVDKKFQSTRGLFVSIMGFRTEVVNDYSKEGSKILFMDGRDLVYILEERYLLQDALKLKIEKAVKEGIIFYPLYS